MNLCSSSRPDSEEGRSQGAAHKLFPSRGGSMEALNPGFGELPPPAPCLQQQQGPGPSWLSASPAPSVWGGCGVPGPWAHTTVLSLTTQERRRVWSGKSAAQGLARGQRLKARVSSRLPCPGHLWGMAWTHQQKASSGIDIAWRIHDRGPIPASIGLNAGGHQPLEGTLIGRT